MLEAANFFVESFNNPIRIHHREYRCAGRRERCRERRLSFGGLSHYSSPYRCDCDQVRVYADSKVQRRAELND